METTKKVVSKDENGVLSYDWTEIDSAAVEQGIEPGDLRDYAFESVTDELTARELVDAYQAWEGPDKETLTNARVYLDADNGPQNVGWVCETDADGHPQFAMSAGMEASDEELIAEARSFATGEITIRRDNYDYAVEYSRSAE